MATQGQQGSVSHPPPKCDQCGKLSGHGGVTLLKCAGCGVARYCGKECQTAAWRGGHKTECRQLAAARREQLITQRLGTGSDGIHVFVVGILRAVGDGRVPTPLDLELLHAIQHTMRSRVSVEPSLVCEYLPVLLALNLAVGANPRLPLDRVRAELVVKATQSALQEYRALPLAPAPRAFFNLVQVCVELLRRLGRRDESMALGRKELPGIDALVATGTSDERHHVAVFLYKLAHDVELVSKQGEDGGGEQGPTLKEGEWAALAASLPHRANAKDRAEAEALSKKALAVAEEAGVNGLKLFPYLFSVAHFLMCRCAYSELLPYARRALASSPPQGLTDTVHFYSQALIQAGNYTEAEKVLKSGLADIGSMCDDGADVAVDDMRARFHYHLGRLLLRRGELEEALSHAKHGQSLALAHVGSCSPAESACRVIPIWDLYGDVLEEMGRLEEARKSDEDAARRAGDLGVSGRRRLIQHLASLGQHEKARDVARKSLCHVLLERHAMEYRVVPTQQENLALEALADAFEATANVDDETLALAKNIRADVAENRAIMEALHQRLLEETREEAAAASGSTRINGDGSKGKKKRSKRKKKGKGKGRTGATQKEGDGTKEETCQGGASGEPSLEAAQEAKEDEEAAECAICLLALEEEEDEEEVTALVCGHHFHSGCVTLWVNKCISKATEATCPICRAAIMY